MNALRCASILSSWAPDTATDKIHCWLYSPLIFYFAYNFVHFDFPFVLFCFEMFFRLDFPCAISSFAALFFSCFLSVLSWKLVVMPPFCYSTNATLLDVSLSHYINGKQKNLSSFSIWYVTYLWWPELLQLVEANTDAIMEFQSWNECITHHWWRNRKWNNIFASIALFRRQVIELSPTHREWERQTGRKKSDVNILPR